MEQIFEWKRIFFNNLPLQFFLEVGFRTVIMFCCILFLLKLTGKRGVKQLSVFEMVIIISLGSAAGDPMFYEDVGLAHCILVLAIVILLYRFVTWLVGTRPLFEKIRKRKTEVLIDEGKFSINQFKHGIFARDEFYSELRVMHIEHLGQIRKAYFEANGEISVFFYADPDVKPGLPILPELFNQKGARIDKTGMYSCAFCGNTKQQTPGKSTCEICEKDIWVPAIHTKRIT